MVRRLPYRLIYDTEISRQLRSIERKYHALIRANIEDQLTYEPEVETNNRKPLDRPVMFGPVGAAFRAEQPFSGLLPDT